MADMPDRVKKRYVKIPAPAKGIAQPPNESAVVDNSAYWHSRGYLPHFESYENIQSITFRLADALPRHVTQRLATEPQTLEGKAAYYRRLEAWLDSGHGLCWLRQPLIASIVKDTLSFYDAKRYRLYAWVIMPNHVHLIVETISPHTLSSVIKDWKSFSAKVINRQLNREGQVWPEGYWDRYIRNATHYKNTYEYIINNPVKAGLVQHPEDWPWLGVPESNCELMCEKACESEERTGRPRSQ